MYQHMLAMHRQLIFMQKDLQRIQFTVGQATGIKITPTNEHNIQNRRSLTDQDDAQTTIETKDENNQQANKVPSLQAGVKKSSIVPAKSTNTPAEESNKNENGDFGW